MFIKHHKQSNIQLTIYCLKYVSDHLKNCSYWENRERYKIAMGCTERYAIKVNFLLTKCHIN